MMDRRQVKGHTEGVGVGGYLRHELLLVLHHLFMVLACCPASLFFRQGRGDYFQGVLFLAELSTPFICLGKVLIQFHQQKTLLHKLNGALVIVVFFCCRVLLFPYLYYTYSRYSSVPLYLVPLEVPWPCNLGAGLLMGLQRHCNTTSYTRHHQRHPDTTSDTATPPATPRHHQRHCNTHQRTPRTPLNHQLHPSPPTPPQTPPARPQDCSRPTEEDLDL
ncbi:hypothetical protein CRUP_024817 [Coryphaenoides rupestris]|nr:hypothetical protein CRUP_024817 [Coryphaenoides rupestris]